MSVIGDILQGIGWSMLLFALLAAGSVGMLLLLNGPGALANFFTVLYGDTNFNFPLPPWMTLVSAVAFPLLNPLVEELQYRGYAQPGLMAASHSVPVGLLVTALGFGLQHIVFTLTPTGAAAYAFGFFLWGLGAGLIYYRQKRLIPLFVAHFISNLGGLAPLIFMIQGM